MGRKDTNVFSDERTEPAVGELLMLSGVIGVVSAFWVEIKTQHVAAEAVLIGLGMVVYFCGWAALKTFN